jgi:hypothetical protein
MMMKKLQLLTLAAIVALLSATTVRAVDYGTIKGSFTIKGMTPSMKKLVPTKDLAVCGKEELHEESLVVSKDGGVANVFIYALGDPADIKKPVANIHESYEKLKKEAAKLDNKGCRFEPRAGVVWTAQKFTITNSDPGIGHNSFGKCFVNPQFNPLIPAGGSVDVPLGKPEKLPFEVSCSIHPWMKSWVMVRPDPYAAASKADGTFEIANIPVGEHTFQIWHESLLFLKTFSVDGKAVTAAKGLYKFKVAKGDNTLKIVIDAKDYAKQIDKLK